MKFSCEKLLLQNAVNTASRAVAAKSSIPALEGLLLTCGGGSLTVSGYNMQTGIRTKFAAEVEESGELVVNARLISEILRRLPDDVVTFTANDKFLIHLTCGDADFDIMGLSAADFPELPEVEEKYAVQIAEKTLKTMIQQTSFAVSTNEARPVHMGSLFEVSAEGLTVVSVDGFRLALRKEALEKIEGGAFSFVAPGTALNEVERICEEIDEVVTITLGQRHILFNVHGRGRAGHRVLEHAADECRALVLGQVRDVSAVDDDLAGVDKERAGGGVEHRGLARAVAADDGDEVAVVQRQTQAVQRGFGVDGAGVKGLIKFLEFKHGRCLRSLRSGAAPCGGTSCSSSRGWRGRPPRSAP